MKRTDRLVCCFLLAMGGGGAAARAAEIQPVEDPQRLQTISRAQGLKRDREAILAMVGDYRVTFAFQEKRPARGYTATQPYKSGAYEMVVVAEDTGDRIVLQHFLVHEPLGFVVKHWRQDWVYEAPDRLEFTDDQTWRKRPLSAQQTRGKWTQCVYEVSDAPRYCGTGRWTYAKGVPSWTSDAGWRPLPRREYTKRSDYNALGVVNTHRITAAGWEHAQDNRKVMRKGGAGDRTLVHEDGVNTYERITGFDFKPGYRYWTDTQDYWRRIRAEWRRRADQNGGIHLTYPVDGMSMIWSMFWQSERARNGLSVSDREIHNLFEPWVVAPVAGK